MRKSIQFLVIVCLFTTTVGCADITKNKSTENHSLYRENHARGQNEIGFFRYDPQDYKEKSPEPAIIIDRSLLAKHIASLVGILPNVAGVTTLVTDDHVFIGIKERDARKGKNTLKEVARTAESVTPRYFKIHVTDKKSLEEKVNAVGIRMRGNHDVEGVKGDLEQLLREMGDETPPNVNESIRPDNRRDVNPNER